MIVQGNQSGETSRATHAICRVNAMPEGGDIFITTFMETRRGSSVEEVCINFSDTGCGIDPSIIDRVFEPFFTTTREAGEGMGLGLASVATSVRAAGGEIEVDSRPQAGTTFRVRLPQATGQAQDVDWDRDHEPEGRGEKVLLVEDSEPLLRILGDYLESVGFNVVRSAGLAEARMALVTAPKDIIVTDIVLQDGRLALESTPTPRDLLYVSVANGQKSGGFTVTLRLD